MDRSIQVLDVWDLFSSKLAHRRSHVRTHSFLMEVAAYE